MKLYLITTISEKNSVIIHYQNSERKFTLGHHVSYSVSIQNCNTIAVCHFVFSLYEFCYSTQHKSNSPVELVNVLNVVE